MYTIAWHKLCHDVGDFTEKHHNDDLELLSRAQLTKRHIKKFVDATAHNTEY